MRKKLFTIIFVFWWAIMFPVLNFSDFEIANLKSDNIQYKSFISEILH